MSEVIAGKDSLIELLVDGIWTPVFCGKDMSVEYLPEFIYKTGPNSIARERMPRLEDWLITVTGLTKIENEEQVSFFYLIQEAIRRTLQSVRATFFNSDGAEKVLLFQAWIGPGTITGPMNQFDQCSVQFIPTGGLSDLTDPESVTPTDFTELSDWWGTTNGNSFIDGPSSGETNGTQYTLVSTDEVLEVDMEGKQYDIVPGTPVVGKRQCQLDLTNNKVIFPTDIVFDGSQTVTVLWKRPI